MTTTIPTSRLVKEQSFLWKNPETVAHPVVAEIFVPGDELELLPGIHNFISLAAGDMCLTVMFVECRPAYSSMLETILVVTEPERDGLRKYLPQFKKEVIEQKFEHAVIFGNGPNGYLDMTTLSFHHDEDEAVYEFKRVAEGLERGDLSVLVARETNEPLLRLEEGVKLLTSLTSTAGMTQPN